LNGVEKYIIVAMTRDKVIGLNGKMPWHLPEDLKLFKDLTVGNTVIMGRKTFESIGKPLPRRHNLVVSRSLKEMPGVDICRSFDQALEKAEEFGKPVFFIGGAEIYKAALEVADYLYVSWVGKKYSGDTCFPQFDKKLWQKIEEKKYSDFTNVLYKRILK